MPGVGGIKPTSKAFAEVWSAVTGQPYRAGMNERVYELRRVITPAPPIPGALRVATEDELSLMSEWVWGFIQDAGLEGTVEGAPKSPNCASPTAICLSGTTGGPVATVTKTRHSTHGIVVSLVYTPPAHRNRWLRIGCRGRASQQLLDAGWEFCSLFTDLANPTSNSIYQRIGYRPVTDFDEYIFGGGPASNLRMEKPDCGLTSRIPGTPRSSSQSLSRPCLIQAGRS